jgi:hypothetical protein
MTEIPESGNEGQAPEPAVQTVQEQPQAAPEPEVAPTRYEDEDAALSRLDPEVEDPTQDKWVEFITKDGEEVKFQKKEGEEAPAEQAPEAEAAPESAQETVQEQPASDPQGVEPERMQKALAALKLDRIPDDVIKTLSPQQILSMGEALKERQREINERLAKSKSSTDEAEDAQATEDAEPAEPTVPSDLQELVKQFSEYYGDEGGEVLTKFASTMQKQFDERLRSQEAQLQAAQGYAQQVMADRVRDQLRGDISELANDDNYSKVVEQMAVLAQTGKYADVAPTVEGRLAKLMRDASLLTFGERSPKAPPAPKPTPTGVQRNTPAGKLTKSDEDDMVLDLLERGLSAEEAERKVRGVIT